MPQAPVKSNRKSRSGMNSQRAKVGSTAADILDAHGGVGPGFDALRLLLAVWVFTIHAMFICKGADAAEQFASDPLHRIIASPVLPMFFAVSGYLVTGSALRIRSTTTFLLFRVFRIAPALIVEVTLSALILGPLLTDKDLLEYFADPLFFRYFLNIVGNVQFFLPGLFAQNPVPGAVNLNLWTLKPEFFCYVFMSAMILSKVIFSRTYFGLIGLLVLLSTTVYIVRGGQAYNFLGVADWKILVVAFIVGCLSFQWNDRIVVSRGYAAIALIVACIAVAYPPLAVPGVLALAYIVIYIGTRKIPLPSFLTNGDYSYGIYLFGFPIQQTLVHFLPSDYRTGWLVLMLGFPLTLGFAMLSWNCIEKPVLQLKNKLRASPRGLFRTWRSKEIGLEQAR